MQILVVDIGGTHVKLLASGRKTVIKIPSTPTLAPRVMMPQVLEATSEWHYSAVSIGYPGVVRHGKPAAEPPNLGTSWVGYDFRRAFGCPVIVINDAAMQAVGSYEGGRMLFLGLGTGLGSALIGDGIIWPTELAHLPYRHGHSYEHYVGAAGLKRLGKKRWRRHVANVITRLTAALVVDDVVVGGGNAEHLTLPDGVRLGSNANAFTGGYRLWQKRWHV